MLQETKEKLIQNIINVWKNGMPREFSKNLKAGMPSRIKNVITNRGFSTEY